LFYTRQIKIILRALQTLVSTKVQLKSVIDQMGRTVQVPIHPKRIVSLVPSQTELLYSLGLDEEVVGQTLFCIHPAHMHQFKPRVGGTKNFKLSKIKALNPDLIIGNKEENIQVGIEELSQHFPVWMSDIENIDDALQMIQDIGHLVGKSKEANQMLTDIQLGFDKLSNQDFAIRTAYFIWKGPWMVAAQHTFINDMMKRVGLVNVFSKHLQRYPEISIEELRAANPQLVLLSSEPYPFTEKHITELRSILPHAHILLVDGESFSWYGSRLLQATHYLHRFQQQLMHLFNR
jgi:ABC-type Fe3+-hydroxamate transport system substrate-binding protein